MESLSAALSIAGHAGSAGSLALPPMFLADVTGLVKEEKKLAEKAMKGTFKLLSSAWPDSDQSSQKIHARLKISEQVHVES